MFAAARVFERRMEKELLNEEKNIYGRSMTLKWPLMGQRTTIVSQDYREASQYELGPTVNDL